MRMKIVLLNVGEGLTSLGFRRMSSHVRSYHEATDSFYLPLDGRPLDRLFPRRTLERSERLCEQVATELAGADVVGFSSLSNYSEIVEGIIARLREKSARTFIVWGGCHGIMAPESAILHADAVCAGEGELAFAELVAALRDGRDPSAIRNFWFRDGEKVTKNPFRPLLSGDELAELPLPSYAEPGERIFLPDSGFVPLRRRHYLHFDGLTYRTVWCIGCPFHCTFCGNTKFIENDPGYQRIRHSPVSTIIAELRQARARHPHIRSVVFDDDSFLALRKETLSDFAERYRAEIGLPFTVTGVIPNYVQEQKLEILVAAGLVRIRMGIQSGSEKMLRFYKRPSPPAKVLSSAKTIHLFADRMIPPAYDIITDNPIETHEDVRDTLQLVFDLPRPFFLNLFSLRVMPNTALAAQFEELGVDADGASHNYKNLAPTLANNMLYFFCLSRFPARPFERLLPRAASYRDTDRLMPRLAALLRLGYHLKRGYDHFRYMGFVNFPGSLSFLFYRVGFVDFWLRFVSPWRKQHRKPGRRGAEKLPGKGEWEPTGSAVVK